jgi:3-oxoacyl-[acyl-carrier protein] reductase
MDLGIKNKRVIVTGASQGIGRAIALAFAAEGCRVAVAARRSEKLEGLVKEMGGEKQGHNFYACDLAEKGASSRAMRALVKRDENFEIVVHNLGGTLNVRDPLAKEEEWLKVWRLNAGIAIEMNALLIPPMVKKKWGRIIHISSVSAEDGRGCIAYGASKAYLNAYVKGIGRQFAKDGLVISAIMPGAVFAEGGHWDEKSRINQADREAFRKKRDDFLRHHHAIGRLGTAEEIAAFVLFMASKHATFAPAATIRVDGGTM